MGHGGAALTGIAPGATIRIRFEGRTTFGSYIEGEWASITVPGTAAQNPRFTIALGSIFGGVGYSRFHAVGSIDNNRFTLPDGRTAYLRGLLTGIATENAGGLRIGISVTDPNPPDSASGPAIGQFPTSVTIAESDGSRHVRTRPAALLRSASPLGAQADYAGGSLAGAFAAGDTVTVTLVYPPSGGSTPTPDPDPPDPDPTPSRPPLHPQSLTLGTPSGGRFTASWRPPLSWNANSGRQYVYRVATVRVGSRPDILFIGDDVLGPTVVSESTTSVTVDASALAAGRYYFVVQARNAAGDSTTVPELVTLPNG